MTRNRGVTLVEIMVMILILAVLAGLILPVLARSRSSGGRMACASNLNQIGKGIFMYADVPANKIFPTSSTSPDPFADTMPMLSLNLLYRGYIADPKVFSCPNKPIPSRALQSITPTVNNVLPAAGTFLSAASCSYGYDPGHGPDDAITALAADRKGSSQNSDNHGPNAGQYVLIGAGTVEWRGSPVHPLGLDAKGVKLEDDTIFSQSTDQRITRNLDSNIRQ